MRLTRSAQKQLLRIDPRYARRILEALRAYEQSGIGDVKALKGRPGYRLRVGDYRAIFELNEGGVDVLDIGHRSSIYD